MFCLLGGGVLGGGDLAQCAREAVKQNPSRSGFEHANNQQKQKRSCPRTPGAYRRFCFILLRFGGHEVCKTYNRRRRSPVTTRTQGQSELGKEAKWGCPELGRVDYVAGKHRHFGLLGGPYFPRFWVAIQGGWEGISNYR